MRYAISIALALLCGVVPATAQPDRERPPRDRQCLTQRNIYSYQAVAGNRSLVVTDTFRRRYRLNFQGSCQGLQFQFGLAFKSRGVGTLSCIERGDSIIMREPVGPNQCFIRDVTYQTRDMDRMDREAARARSERRR